MPVRRANADDLPSLIGCDVYAQGSQTRRTALGRWLSDGAVYVDDNEGSVVGLVVADDTFFGHLFIHLVSVTPTHRRRGVAARLLHAAEAQSATGKVFTSTNRSNSIAQQLFTSVGYVFSGRIEHLDENDPEFIYFKRVVARCSDA